MSESLSGALDGLRVSLDDLSGTADYLDAVADHWDDTVGRYVNKHIDPVMAKVPDAHQVATFTNPHGQFDQATNLKHDIQDAQDKLTERIQHVSTLLRRLQQITQQIANNYQETELSNQAKQKQLLALIDADAGEDDAR